jgi:hypothetical protein
MTWKRAFVIYGVAIGAFAIFHSVNESRKTPEERALETKEKQDAARASAEQSAFIDAKHACREAVKVRLRAPSTADFQGTVLGEWTVTGEKGSYLVTSFVDAQNGFGAKIRTRFVCGVDHPGKRNQKVSVVLGE